MTRSAGRSRPRTCASAWPAPAAPTTSTASTATTSSNYVQYVGRHLPEADFRAIETCPAFRQAVNDGDYDYLITTPELDLNNPSTAELLAGARLGEERPGRPGGAAFRARLGVPDQRPSSRPAAAARRTGAGRRANREDQLDRSSERHSAITSSVCSAWWPSSSRWRSPAGPRAAPPFPAGPDPPALLADTVLAIGILIVVAELLGLFGDPRRGAAGRGLPDRRWRRAAARADADPRRRPRRPLGPLRGAGPAAGAGGRPHRARRGGHPRPDRRGAVGGPDAPGARPRHLRRRLALVPHAARRPHRADRTRSPGCSTPTRST